MGVWRILGLKCAIPECDNRATKTIFPVGVKMRVCKIHWHEYCASSLSKREYEAYADTESVDKMSSVEVLMVWENFKQE